MKINSAIYDTWKAANASGILNHNPEGRHNFVKYASHGAEKFPYLTDKLAELLKIDLPSSTYNIGPLEIRKGALGLSAGMLKQSYGLRLREALGFDYLVIGGLTANAQPGNRKPRIFKFPKEQSMVNGMGLPGDGIDAEIARLEKRKLKGMMPKVPLIANLCNSAVTSTLEEKIIEFKQLMEKLYPYVQGFEINVSCPNQHGVTDMQAEKTIQKLLTSIKTHNEYLATTHKIERKALLVKIAPLTKEWNIENQEFKTMDNIKDLTPEGLKIVTSICEENVDGITATNTAQEHDFREKTHITTSTGGTITGGMSGKELFPQALATVQVLRKETQLPILGVGGIGYELEGKDILEMEKAGANIFQLLSAVVQGPYGPFTPYHLKQLQKQKIQSHKA